MSALREWASPTNVTAALVVLSIALALLTIVLVNLKADLSLTRFRVRSKDRIIDAKNGEIKTLEQKVAKLEDQLMDPCRMQSGWVYLTDEGEVIPITPMVVGPLIPWPKDGWDRTTPDGVSASDWDNPEEEPEEDDLDWDYDPEIGERHFTTGTDQDPYWEDPAGY